jgi:hypothetical protein
MRKVLIS